MIGEQQAKRAVILADATERAKGTRVTPIICGPCGGTPHHNECTKVLIAPNKTIIKCVCPCRSN